MADVLVDPHLDVPPGGERVADLNRREAQVPLPEDHQDRQLQAVDQVGIVEPLAGHRIADVRREHHAGEGTALDGRGARRLRGHQRHELPRAA
ncbi:MAG: hypothetical protein U1F11_03600 [Steroidobacteraceae bacterium]